MQVVSAICVTSTRIAKRDDLRRALPGWALHRLLRLPLPLMQTAPRGGPPRGFIHRSHPQKCPQTCALLLRGQRPTGIGGCVATPVHDIIDIAAAACICCTSCCSQELVRGGLGCLLAGAGGAPSCMGGSGPPPSAGVGCRHHSLSPPRR